jgi:hypothetical protein
MDSTTLIPEIREVKEGAHKFTTSLYELRQHEVDGRAARGKRYELAALLVLLMLAKLARMKSLLGAKTMVGTNITRVYNG